MEYERIHKVQVGVISPSKLRIKLLGSHGVRKKEGSNSSRASPSKVEEIEYSKSSLLAGDLDEEVGSRESKDASLFNVISSSEDPRLDLSVKEGVLGYGQGNLTPSFRKGFVPKGKADLVQGKDQTSFHYVSSLSQPSGNLSTVHPMRSLEEDGYGYDSGHENGSTHSFEFHRGERVLQQQVASPFFRSLPSKWNDAEKWIVHRSSNVSKKNLAHNQGMRQVISNRVIVAPQSITAGQSHSFMQAADTKRSNLANSASQNAVEKFSFVPNCRESSLDSTSGLTDLSSASSDYGSLPSINRELNQNKLTFSECPATKVTVNHSVQSVSMRDVGTEMTPIPSQEPSRTGTPIGAMTPARTPLSSIPSSPKRAAPAPSPVEKTKDEESRSQKKVGKIELSERELKLKTRREIAALGIQLGKLSIASWASKDEMLQSSPLKAFDVEQVSNAEYEARAVAWEESQKSKHTARYKHEEAKIQAWESRQKAKYEAKMKRVEAEFERMKVHAQDKLMEKLAVTHQRVEHKQATAEARRSRQVARTDQQVEQIRQTGRVPSSHFRCCGWLFLS